MPRNTTRRKRRAQEAAVALLILLLLAALFYLYDIYFKKDEPVTIPEGAAAVYYIDVGQGDAALIVSPKGETMLIDAGEHGDAAAFLKENKIEKLDYLVFTHFDSDHIGGGEQVLDATEVKKVITPDCTPSTKTGLSLIEAIGEEGAEHLKPEQGMKIALGDITFEILSDERIFDGGKNDDSVVMMMTFGKNKFLFTGDAEKKRETQVVEDYGRALDADVMKAGHHGAKNANNENLLELVTPDIVVISCGTGNKYGHPTAEALERFAKFDAKILRTDTMGTVTLFSDGEALTYETEKKESATNGAANAVVLFFEPQKSPFTRSEEGGEEPRVA